MSGPLSCFVTPSCAVCGDDLATVSPKALFCSKRCCDVARGQNRAERLPAQVCALPGCGVTFTPRRPMERCCSERHGKALWNRESRADGRQKPQPWNDRMRDAYHRRRALKKSATTGDRVVFSEIAERDRWRCCLCGGRVSRSKPWPDPLSPSLDHLVPLSRGGAHDPANVGLAHLRCNSAKGNRGGGEQLLLIGGSA